MRGGRSRRDGLIPGSTEAAEADRAADAKRKKDERAERRALLEPAPLPAAALAGPVAPPADSPVAGPLAPVVPFVPWDRETLKPLFDELIPTVERLTVQRFTERAEKAKLPADFVKQVGRDAQWSAPARKAIELSASQVAARWLNKSGISAENQAEVVLCTAALSILATQRALLRRLDKMIAERTAQEAKEKK
jgi:hypothetical protein